MKKITISILALITMSLGLTAQNTQDLLRYSYTTVPYGTARFMGMGGSFGALGGDMSAISYNPASVGVYQSSSFGFTSALNFNQTNTNFNGEIHQDRTRPQFNFNNMGMVWTFKAPRDVNGTAGDRWENSNFAITYNRKNNFYEDYQAKGRNWESSVSDAFVDEAAAVGVDNANSPTYLAYQTYLLDDFDGYDTPQSDFRVNNKYSQMQEFLLNKSGHQGSLDFSFGGNYAHKLYVGAAMGMEFAYFEQEKFITETGDRNAIPGFNHMYLDEYLDVSGFGMNLKAGAIYRPLKFLRVGATVHSPTWFSFTETYSADMTTSITFDEGDESNTVSEEPGPFDYNITTPYRIIGSIALLDGRIGTINAEVEFIDYTWMFIDAYGVDNMSDINDQVPNVYKPVVNSRIGGEFILGGFALRGGFGYYPSPYMDEYLNSEFDRYVYTAGAGYTNGNFFVDLAMMYSKYQRYDILYSYGSNDYANSEASISSLNVNTMLTLGWNF